MKIYELLDRPERWTKGKDAADKTGRPVNPRDPVYLEAFFASLDGLRPPVTTAPKLLPRSLSELGSKTIKINTFGGTTYDQLALSLLSAYVIRCNDEARDITEYLNHPGLKEWRMS